ncbi:MAG: hypothetical protein COB02_16995 [Candidatus Cloacimonadota bacterium]|nr:MAG: hypothetical protein COB02_16995 [Candidatus Cloacimonadota bacterium]
MKTRQIKKQIKCGYNGISQHIESFYQNNSKLLNKKIKKILRVLNKVEHLNTFEASCYLSDLLEFIIYDIINPDLTIFPQLLTHSDDMVRILSVETCEEWDLQNCITQILFLIKNDPDDVVRRLAVGCISYLMRNTANEAILLLSKLEPLENHPELKLWYSYSYYKLRKININNFLENWSKQNSIRTQETMKNLLKEINNIEDKKRIHMYFTNIDINNPIIKEIIEFSKP